MKSKTVIWTALFVLVPAFTTVAANAYLAGQAMLAVIGAVLAVGSALLFLVSFAAEFPFEEDVKGMVKKYAPDNADEAKADAQEIKDAVKKAGITPEDIEGLDGYIQDLIDGDDGKN